MTSPDGVIFRIALGAFQSNFTPHLSPLVRSVPTDPPELSLIRVTQRFLQSENFCGVVAALVAFFIWHRTMVSQLSMSCS